MERYGADRRADREAADGLIAAHFQSKYAPRLIQDVEDRLSGGEDPIELSIEKWELIQSLLEEAREAPDRRVIVIGLKDHIGFKTCALCSTSADRFRAAHGDLRFASDKCKMCPLAEIDRCVDSGSTHDQIAAVIEECTQEPKYEEAINQLATLTQTMIRNLKQLEPDS